MLEYLKSISGHRMADQCICVSSLAAQCSHPCISCEDAAPASTAHAAHLGSRFLRLTLAWHQSCSLIGQLPNLWPLIGCSQVPTDLWVMQSFLSPNTINSSRTAPFRFMGDQGCFQAKFIFFYQTITDNDWISENSRTSHSGKQTMIHTTFMIFMVTFLHITWKAGLCLS